MNKMEMYTSLNKGVPSYIPITLDIETLIRECSDNEEKAKQEFRQIGNTHQRIIARIANMTKAERFFFKKLKLWTNRRTSETNLYVSADSFLEQLKIILNVTGYFPNEETLLTALDDKINRLFYIKTPEELQKEFPLIYDDYLLSIKAEQQIQALIPVKPKEVIREQWQFYNMYGLSSSFNQFMNRQRIMYRNLVSKRKKIEIEQILIQLI